jgi:hypothetical protein
LMEFLIFMTGSRLPKSGRSAACQGRRIPVEEA